MSATPVQRGTRRDSALSRLKYLAPAAEKLATAIGADSAKPKNAIDRNPSPLDMPLAPAVAVAPTKIASNGPAQAGMLNANKIASVADPTAPFIVARRGPRKNKKMRDLPAR